MRSRRLVFFFIAAFILLSITGPGTLLAADIQLIVNNAANASCSRTAAPPCFPSIQEAINYANTNYVNSINTGTILTYSILLERGTYGEVIELKSGVSVLQGRETAKTFLIGSGTVIAVNSGNPTISNLFFQNAAIGIEITNNAAATISNNIFNLGLNGTAVKLTQSSTLTRITNNTFSTNNIAISSPIAVSINNNIFFSNNTVPAVPVPATANSFVANNDFFLNATDPLNGLLSDGASNISGNPLFVDSVNGDFHLLAGSPCIGAGSGPSDIGAYGGPNADTIPMQVSNVIATPSTSISLTWNANLSYEVIGYRIYYGSAPRLYDGTGAAEGASPINVSTVTSATLSGLTTTVPPPAKPALSPVTALNESLALSWDAVPGATGYRVYSDIDDGTSSPPTTLKATVNTASYTLAGLTNNVKYKIAVSAIAQAIYYIAVTALNTNATSTSTPGIAYESAYSQEVNVPFGDIQESVHSDFVVDFPEALVGYPNLQNSRRGCFIATAAYGSYIAPEVQALRAFRDRYLLSNRAGSAFVRWYYEHGPVAAAWLDAHPGYKPVVRAALLPAVGLALFMTGTSLYIKTVVALLMLIITLMLVNGFFRKKLSGSGGA